MRRMMRWIGLLLLLVVIGLGVAMAWLTLTFDPEDLKNQIARQVETKTGRTLHLEGPLNLSFFPRLGVKAEAVKLGNPPSFADEDFVSAERVEARVDLVPLLDGQVVVDTLVLEGVSLNLHRAQDGAENWADLMAASQPPSAPADATEPGMASRWIKGYVVQGIALSDTRIVWRDDTSGAHHVIDNLSVATGSIAPGSAVPIEAGLRLTSADGKPMGSLQARGDLGLSKDLSTISVPNLDLNLTEQSTGQSLQMQADLTFDQPAGRLDLADLKLTGPGALVLEGQLSAALAEQPPAVKGRLALQPLNPRKLAGALGISVPETRDPAVLAQLSGELDITATADRVQLKPLYLVLDDTRISGEIGLRPGSPPALSFNLEADAIDADRYLEPEDEQAAAASGSRAAAQPGATPGAQDQDNPLGALAAFNADGVITLGSLKVAGLSMSNVRVKMRSAGGTLSLDPMTAALYGGQYKGNLHLKPRRGKIGWEASEQLSSVQIGPLLKDVSGEDRLEGTGNLDATLRGVGLSDGEIRRSLEGQASFDFKDGALVGVNLAQLARDIKARLKGDAASQNGPQKTDFSQMSGTLNFAQGRVSNKDLMMKSPYLRVEGKGSADLVTEAIDYLLTAKVVATSKGQGGDDISELEGVVIPVAVAGTFTEPTFSPDLEAALKALAGKRLEEEKAKLAQKAQEQLTGEQEKLEKKIQDEVGKALRKLF